MVEHLPERLIGRRIALRLARPDDAEFIHSLRVDPDLSRYLSQVNGTVNGQRAWLDAYLSREAQAQEFYFVIEDLGAARPCGTVRLYGIAPDCFTWGSFVVTPHAPRKAALEAAILSFGFGFETLGKDVALVDVRKDNLRARQFYERLEMTYLRETAEDIYFEYPRAQFEAAREDLWGAVDAG